MSTVSVDALRKSKSDMVCDEKRMYGGMLTGMRFYLWNSKVVQYLREVAEQNYKQDMAGR